jgi:hypothetical protein
MVMMKQEIDLEVNDRVEFAKAKKIEEEAKKDSTESK